MVLWCELLTDDALENLDYTPSHSASLRFAILKNAFLSHDCKIWAIGSVAIKLYILLLTSCHCNIHTFTLWLKWMYREGNY